MDNPIRPMTLEDLPAVKKVIDANELFPSDLLDDMTAGYFADEEESGYWLTYNDREAIAVAYYTPERMTEGTWNALLLAVRPDYQGKGLGGTLMGHIEQTLRERSARVLLVETSGLDNFDRTRTFYHKNGYEEEARIREFYARGEDKIIFRKLL